MANIMGAKRKKKLHDEVMLANRRLTKMAESGRYDAIPSGYTYEDLVSRIHSVSDFNGIIRFLRMSDERYNKGGLTPVKWDGEWVPKYAVDLLEETGGQINKRRQKDTSILYENWEQMDTVEKMTRLANVGLANIHVEDYSVEELGELFNERYPNVLEKADIYIQTWQDWGGDPEVPDIIRKLAEENPDRFIRIMDSNYDQKEIYFIYPSKELMSRKKNDRGWIYKNQSANESPLNERQQAALKFWRDVESGKIIP